MIAMQVPDVLITAFLCCLLVIESRMSECPPPHVMKIHRRYPWCHQPILLSETRPCSCDGHREAGGCIFGGEISSVACFMSSRLVEGCSPVFQVMPNFWVWSWRFLHHRLQIFIILDTSPNRLISLTHLSPCYQFHCLQWVLHVTKNIR